MTKRTGSTTERPRQLAGASRRASGGQVTQPPLPTLSLPAPEPAPRAKPARRASSPATTVEVAQRLAPSKGPRRAPRTSQGPAVTPKPGAEANATPEPQSQRHTSRPGRAQPATTTPSPRVTHDTNTTGRRFADLRDALADGWEIVQPIFARPLWSAADDSQTAFNFVLRREQATKLVTVPNSGAVERFIATHRLTVDYRV